MEEEQRQTTRIPNTNATWTSSSQIWPRKTARRSHRPMTGVAIGREKAAEAAVAAAPEAEAAAAAGEDICMK